MEVLDLRGLKCPLPALLARRALARTAAGGEVEIVSDDPLAAIDVPHMCNREGYEVLAIERFDAAVRIVLRRGDGSGSQV
jgi:tRNA 2-thiouridine synthesizing protein A